MTNRHTRRGVTLIELLVVVLIIGILSAVVLPQYQKTVWKTRYTQAKIMVHAIVHAQEIYYLANGQYTTSFADLDIDTPAYQTETTDKTSTNQTRTHRIFKWGGCHLWETDSVTCTVSVNGEGALGYAMPYAHAENNPLKSSCLVYSSVPTTSPLNNICKAETGLAEPTESGTDYVRYRP